METYQLRRKDVIGTNQHLSLKNPSQSLMRCFSLACGGSLASSSPPLAARFGDQFVNEFSSHCLRQPSWWNSSALHSLIGEQGPSRFSLRHIHFVRGVELHLVHIFGAGSFPSNESPARYPHLRTNYRTRILADIPPYSPILSHLEAGNLSLIFIASHQKTRRC